MKKTWSRVLATVLVLAMVLCMPGFAASVADTADYDADHAASAEELTDADLPELLSSDGNHYPIVLVHGLFGWGGTEVLGLNYWGGFSSLRDILNDAGYKVYTPSIGPVASNWDRACELYAYLVGGTVDYGAYHSATNGHARYGRTFPGVLPELNNPDSELKVHLVMSPLDGTTVTVFSVTELMYDETMADWRTHNGIDIQASEGDSVRTAAGGTVLSVKDDELMGTTVVIQHGGGYTTQYSCLQKDPPVQEGDQVAAGDVIGLVGSTASAEGSMGPHLHFSVSKDGQVIDPADYVN